MFLFFEHIIFFIKKKNCVIFTKKERIMTSLEKQDTAAKKKVIPPSQLSLPVKKRELNQRTVPAKCRNCKITNIKESAVLLNGLINWVKEMEQRSAQLNATQLWTPKVESMVQKSISALITILSEKNRAVGAQNRRVSSFNYPRSTTRHDNQISQPSMIDAINKLATFQMFFMFPKQILKLCYFLSVVGYPAANWEIVRIGTNRIEVEFSTEYMKNVAAHFVGVPANEKMKFDFLRCLPPNFLENFDSALLLLRTAHESRGIMISPPPELVCCVYNGEFCQAFTDQYKLFSSCFIDVKNQKTFCLRPPRSVRCLNNKQYVYCPNTRKRISGDIDFTNLKTILATIGYNA